MALLLQPLTNGLESNHKDLMNARAMVETNDKISRIKALQKEIEQEKLFNPLRINNTYYYWTTGQTRLMKKQYAVEHDENGKPINYEKYTVANASANLLTTAEDYAKFLVYMLNGASLSKKNYVEFLKVQAHEKEGIDGA